MPEIREPSVEGINKTFRFTAQFLSTAVSFLLVTACSTVDLGMASPDRISQAYQSVAAYPPNDDLSHHVSAETLSELRLVLNYLGLSFKAAQKLRPGFLAGVITDRLSQRAGFREEFGVDRHFYREAVQANKTVTGLETLQAQTSVYSLDDRQSESDLQCQGMFEQLPVKCYQLQVLGLTLC